MHRKVLEKCGLTQIVDVYSANDFVGKIASIKQELNSIWRSAINNKSQHFQGVFLQWTATEYVCSWELRNAAATLILYLKVKYFLYKHQELQYFWFVFADSKIPNSRTP